MKRLEWFFSLVDRVSAPVRRINAGLAGAQRALRSVDGTSRATQRVLSDSFGASQRAIERLAAALMRLGNARAALTVVAAHARTLWAALAAIPGRIFTLPNLIIGGATGLAAKGLIDQIGFIEQQRIALGTILNSPIRGQAALEWAIRFADRTPFETPQVLEAMQRALAVGFTTRQIEPLLTTLGDAASALALGPQGLNDLIQVFGQIRSAGKLMTEDVYQLTERGIPAFEMLARGFGTDIPGVRKMLERGEIASDAALKIIYEGLRERFGGGMERQSRSLFGLVSTLRSRPQMLAFRLDQSSAVEPLRRTLANLAELTDFSRPPGSTIGKNLEAGLGGLFRAAFGPLVAATEPQMAAAKIQAFLSGTTAMVERARQAWPGIRAAVVSFASGAQIAIGALQSLWRAIEPMIAALGRMFDGLGAAQAGMSGSGSAAFRLIGIIAALAAGWRVLNAVTLGGAAAILRWIAAATLAVARPFVAQLMVAGLPALWSAISALGTLGITALRTAAIAMAAGTRMAIAWLIGLGPIGWLIGAVAGISAALVAAYNRVAWFRNAVNAAWNAIVATGQGLIQWFSSLPDRIGATFARLPELLRGLLRQAIELLPPGVRDVVQGLAGGFLGIAPEVGQAAAQVANAVDVGFREPLEIRSPSRRFAYFGRMLGAGLEQGTIESVNRVRRAALALGAAAGVAVAAPAPALAAPAGAPMRSISITIGDIVVQNAPEQNARQIAQTVRNIAVEAVLEALERAALEEGYEPRA